MQLPVIDFSGFAGGTAADRHAVAAAIDAACRETGFFVLAGHGLERQVSDTAFAAAKQFFDRPTAEKQAISIDRSACHRGWYGEGGEVLDAAAQPDGDRKEGLKIGRDLPLEHPRVQAGLPLHGPNQWPDQDGFEPAMRACYAACETLSRALMQAFALSLGLDEDHFEAWLTLPMATLSPLRYPPQTEAAKLGAGAHTDFGCLTLLLQHDVGGLQVETQAGWVDVPCDPALIVVNIGDMMARWTNDRYASTRHRVVNRSGTVRHSMAYFFDPDPDADLSPLPGCLAEGEARHYADATALQHLLTKIDESFAYRQSDT